MTACICPSRAPFPCTRCLWLQCTIAIL